MKALSVDTLPIKHEPTPLRFAAKIVPEGTGVLPQEHDAVEGWCNREEGEMNVVLKVDDEEA